VIRIAVLILAIIFLLGTLCLLGSGGVLLWVYSELADDEGFVTTGVITIQNDSHAIITDPLDIDEKALLPFNWLGLNMIRIGATGNNTSQSVFLGIATRSQVNRYLGDSDYVEMFLTTEMLSLQEIDYVKHTGDGKPQAPIDADIWKTSTYGEKSQTLEWQPRASNDLLVIMNADGTAGLDLSLEHQVHISSTILALSIVLISIGTAPLAISFIALCLFLFRNTRLFQTVISHLTRRN